LHVWDPANGKVTDRIGAHLKPLTSLLLVPSNNTILSAAADQTVCLWKIAPQPKLLVHADQVTSVAATSDGKLAVTGCADKGLRLPDGDVDSKTELSATLTGLAVSPDGSRVAASCQDGLSVWDAAKPAPAKLIHMGWRVLGFSGDGKRLAVATPDNRVWQLDADGQPLEYLEHDGAVSAAAFSDGHRLVTASADKTARVWTPALVWQRRTADRNAPRA